MSSGLFPSPNEAIVGSRTLLEALRLSSRRILLAAVGDLCTSRDPVTPSFLSSLLGLPEDAVTQDVEMLQQAGLLSTTPHLHLSLTPRGQRWYQRIVTNLRSLVGQSVGSELEAPSPLRLRGQYTIDSVLGSGGTSVTFRATQTLTHNRIALKVIYPGFANTTQLDEALLKRQRVSSPTIPRVLDAGTISGERFQFGGDPLCVCLELVNGDARTLDDFLRSEIYSAPHFLSRFIREVGGALEQIHRVDLAHNDLHSGNILVSHDPAGEPQFHVIDFVGLDLIASPHFVRINDDEAFFYHVLRAVMIAHEREPQLPIRRLVGDNVWRVVEGIRQGDIATVEEAVRILDTESMPLQLPLTPARTRPFEWLRVESIPSPDDLFKLFEPAIGHFEEVQQFGNMWISGPRGCGKSHYVRVLAFYPDVEVRRERREPLLDDEFRRLNLNYRERFGVLVPCRVGTFKSIAPEALGASQFEPSHVPVLKDLLILTILSHALDSIATTYQLADAYDIQSPLGSPSDIGALSEFWRSRADARKTHGSPIAQLESIREQVTRESMKARRSWYERFPHHRALLDDSDLAAFFDVLAHSVEHLQRTRFDVIFDDVTDGIVHLELQKVLNSLVRSAGDRHCFKLTSEKYRYTLESSDGRSIEFPHDASFIDLGELGVGTTKAAPRSHRSYYAAVINRRLRLAGWNANIRTVVGPSEDPLTFLNKLRRTYRDDEGSPNQTDESVGRESAVARYAGWNVYSHLAHGSIRNLLEMLEHTFAVAGGTEQALSGNPVSALVQDQALRQYSRRHWLELRNLPGRVGSIQIGPQLHSIAAAVGELSRRFLLGSGPDFPYEALSLERRDPAASLSPDAEAILESALRYAIFIETGANFSRSHRGLTARLDLNKLFAPAFRTTYRVRNHIFVNSSELEELLLRPSTFLRRRLAKVRFDDSQNRFDI